MVRVRSMILFATGVAPLAATGACLSGADTVRAAQPTHPVVCTTDGGITHSCPTDPEPYIPDQGPDMFPGNTQHGGGTSDARPDRDGATARPRPPCPTSASAPLRAGCPDIGRQAAAMAIITNYLQ